MLNTLQIDLLNLELEYLMIKICLYINNVWYPNNLMTDKCDTIISHDSIF